VESKCRTGALRLLLIDTLGGGVLANPRQSTIYRTGASLVPIGSLGRRNFLRRLFGGLRSFLAQRRAGFRRQVRDCFFRFRRSSCFLNVLLGCSALSRCSHRSLSFSFTVIFRSDTLPASTSVSDPRQVTTIVFVFFLVYFLPDRMTLVYRICRRAIVFSKNAKTSTSSANFILFPPVLTKVLTLDQTLSRECPVLKAYGITALVDALNCGSGASCRLF
jgi:hypothetical protein